MYMLKVLFCDANGCCKSPVLYQWETGELNLMGLEMGMMHYRGLFSKAFYSKVLTDPDSLDDLMFFICISHY